MNQYIELYNELKPLLAERSSSVLNAQREEAIATFGRLSFPARKVERYRYTDVAKAFEPDYGMSLAPLTIKNVPYVYTEKDAPIDITPYYNKVATMHHSPSVKPDARIRMEDDALTALNTAITPDVLVVNVPKNTKAEHPIRIENTLTADKPTMMVRRVLIVMEECSEATVFFVDHGDGDVLVSQVVEVVCKDGSHLDMYELEETSGKSRRFNNVYIQTGRDCSVRHNNVTLTNGVTRNGIDVYMQGEGADVTLNGAIVADGEQHVDNNTLIDHQVGKCTSNELYKYVLDDSAICAFAGKILVREDAQQTYSQETNNNMCTSEAARMFTQPMLEIYADDVKCAHGSTVGVMDENALFYMQQRGIPQTVARNLLKNAFISQVIDEMKWESFRDRLHILVDKRLSNEERCGTCKICK